jgi:hypothetical protein
LIPPIDREHILILANDATTYKGLDLHTLSLLPLFEIKSPSIPSLKSKAAKVVWNNLQLSQAEKHFKDNVDWGKPRYTHLNTNTNWKLFPHTVLITSDNTQFLKYNSEWNLLYKALSILTTPY